MADQFGNIRFDEKTHEWCAELLADAVNDVTSLYEVIIKLYPNSDHGAADRARRSVRSASRDLAELMNSLEALSHEETNSHGPYRVKLRQTPEKSEDGS